MDYVNLGKTGVKVSRLCLGCMTFGSTADWMISEGESQEIIKRALDAGINFFDTADVYSHGASEEILGRALKSLGVSRYRSVIATKVYGQMSSDPNGRGLSRKHIMHSIDASLKRLGTDYVDLYQIHRFDTTVPMEETLEALSDVVKAGKALYIGASSMWAWQFCKYLQLADRLGLSRFVSMQNCYNLAYREEEREMMPLCRAEGIGVIPWSPLAGGLLAGTRRAGTIRSKSSLSQGRYTRPSDERVVDAVATVASTRGVNPAAVAIAWLLAQPGVTAPIIGISKLAQIEDPIKALEITLTPEETKTLEEPYVAQRPIGNN